MGSRLWSSEPTPTAEQVFAADDVRTSSGSIEGGGIATVVYSKDVGAGVLVMNNVAPPAEGTVYQMWLMNDQGSAQPAGTMDATAVAPSTTAWQFGVHSEVGKGSDFTITGTSDNELTGSIIAVSSNIKIAGVSGTQGLHSQIIGYTVEIEGSTDLLIEYVPEEQYWEVDPTAVTLTK